MTSAARSSALPRAHGTKTLISVSFICAAPEAARVSVVGDFNQWNPEANPLEKSFDGAWNGSVGIRHGHHQYAFCVDGVLKVDPRGQGVSRNARGERVSILAVS